ncbi:MAG: hypothetical protein HFH72_11870 [Lachnospiraceae bacterium]|nr:hypothetical protein [Lachnospiraceae bacterium]
MARLEEIKAKYNISAGDLDEIRSALKRKLKESHPDNNKEYNSDYFTELNNDLSYVESLIKNSENQNTLVSMNEVLQTLAEILQTPVKKDKDAKEVLNEKISANIQSRLLITRKRLRTPRIGSTTVVAIITFLWMFPSQVMEHPLIQMAFGDTIYATRKFALVITGAWLLTLLYTIMIWGMSIHIERKEKDIMERVKLESVQNEIFMNFLNSISPSKKFSKWDFMKYLAYGLSEEQEMRKTLNFKPEEEIVQNIADIILLRVKEYKIISPSKSHDLIECYEIIQDESA